MAHYSDTTLSDAPLSPFSSRSLLSDGTQTSDEPADLGAFNSVFRVMNQLQHQQSALTMRPRADSITSTSEFESDVGESSTVWNHQPIASYLHDESNESNTSYSPEEEERNSDTEGLYEDVVDLNDTMPSLGDLDSALGFLAAERAKLTALQLDSRNAGNSSTGESAWRHVIEPKRKRRRKRRGPTRVLDHDDEIPAGTRTVTVVPTPEASSSSPDPDLSSSPDKDGAGPPQLSRRSKDQSSSSPLYSPSSPPGTVLRPSSTPLDPRLVRLRTLAKKLRHDFPQHDARLRQVLVDDFPAHDLIDPRGPDPQVGDALTHVFIDHSNILVGFLNYVKRSRKNGSGKPLLSFPALSLILERGRPISRRILATSSPLYQNMDIAEDLGYSVHVYVRVPDFSGDITSGSTNSNNNNTSNGAGNPAASRGTKLRKGVQNISTASPVNRNATESDPGQMSSPTTSRGTARSSVHSRSISATTVSISISTSNASAASSSRVRYREQGVDELLQLKLHQALVSPEADPPPPGATIILATGDGASGQFNEDGFVGVVRTALNKGWTVELYAWGGGISNVWRKVAEEEGRSRLKIWEMDPYAGDLLDAVTG